MSGTARRPRLSRAALVGLVAGAMIGSGVFSLPSTLSRPAGGLAALIAWSITGAGALMLALVFGRLARRRPDLETGVHAYAREGFGRYMGFNAALGYWLGCCLADVVCLVHIMATLGTLIPAFGNGASVPTILGATVLLWGCHAIVLHDLKTAVLVNGIATVLKIIPIIVFIGVAVVGFRADIFALNAWGDEAPTLPALGAQVRASMLLTVFAFIGMEAASVFSRHARRREDIGFATVLGCVSVLCLAVLVSMLSFGLMLRPELAALPSPAMGSVMASLVGPWGWGFISGGLLISILGNYLAWSLLATQVLHAAARAGAMPAFLAEENDRGSPAASLWLTNIVVQAFLLVSWFAEHAFTLALQLTSSMTLLPYLLVAGYGLKLAWTGETYAVAPGARGADGWCSALALAFVGWVMYAGGLKFMLLSSILYASGTLLFLRARRDQPGPAFAPGEWLLFVGLALLAFAALVALSVGTIRL